MIGPYQAMEYWPERVKEKCKTNRSLAIAHGIEFVYEASSNSSESGKKGEKNI